MPLRPEYVNDPLFRRVVELERKVEQLAQRSNQVITRGALRIATDWEPTTQPRMRLGMLPDERHAMALYDPSGNELLRVGEQSDGRFGQDVSSPTGTRVLRLGQLPDGTYGLAAYDDGGNERVRFGQLPGGGYGALMNLQAANDPWTITRNASGFGDGTAVLEVSGSLNPGPSVTISTGSRALVWTSVYIQCAAAGVGGHVSYRLSGATTSAPNAEVARYAILESTTAAGVRARVGSVHLQALNPGSNTFKLEYDSNASTAVSFAYRTIAVLPI